MKLVTRLIIHLTTNFNNLPANCQTQKSIQQVDTFKCP
jgi:hypothetical protein